MSSDQWGRVSAVLTESSLRTTPILDALEAQVPELDDRETLLDVFTALEASAQAYDWSPDDVAETISADTSLDLSPADRETLRTRLSEGLRSQAVNTASRALAVVTSYDRMFTTARVLTDIRPVFPDDARAKPIACTVSHTLRIDYFREGDPESVYITMDNSDLKVLGKAITRAEDKVRSLTDLLDAIEVPIYDPWGAE